MTFQKPKTLLSLLPVLLMVVLIGPVSFVLFNRYFTLELLNLGLSVSGLVLLGILINWFMATQLCSKVAIIWIHALSFFLSVGIFLSSLVVLIIRKPFFLAFGIDMLVSYAGVLFLVLAIINFLVNGSVLYQKRAVEQEQTLMKERMMRDEMERKLHTSRVNPHFLFNSLNLMVSLLDDRERAEEVLIQLADLLRYNLEAVKHERIALNEEMKIVNNYMSIQMARFGDRLSFEVSGDCDFSVPPMIIQPLVENSIKHNIKEADHLHVGIEIRKGEVFVFDSQRKMDNSMIGKGTGLSVTAKRMALLGGALQIKDGGILLCFQRA